MTKTRFVLAFASSVSLLAPGCKDGANKTAPAPAPMVKEAAPIGAAPIEPARPGDRVFMAPPLGAPDLIAPPTLDLIPGMRASDATAKGAKPAGKDDNWTWRPEAELDIDDDHGIIDVIAARYAPAEIEALKQKWGKPTHGDDEWMGANWHAEVGSCDGEPPCYVFFTRAANAQFFGKRPVPPLGLAKVAYDMSAADVTKLFAIEPDGEIATGYGYSARFDFTDDRFRSVTLARTSYNDTDAEIALIKSLWGASAKPDELVWVDTAARWAAVHDYGQITYYPIALWSDLLAKDGTYSIMAASAQLLGKKASEVEVGDRERTWPGTEADPTETIHVELSFDDETELVTAVDFSIEVPEDLVARHVALVEKTLGKAKVTKTEDGEEESIIKTGGLAIRLHQSDIITLSVRKP